MEFLRKIIEHIVYYGEPIIDQWGYIIVFLISFFESIPIIGFFIPGSLIIVFFGFLTKLGYLSVPKLVVLVFFGTLAGDILSFYLGRRYGYELIYRYGKYFYFKIEYVEKVKQFIGNHTGKSLVFGKFNSITRSLVSYIIGASAIRKDSFLYFVFIGSFFFSTFHVFLGYLFAKGYEFVSDYAGYISLIAIIVSVVIIFLYNFINKYHHVFSRYNLYTLTVNLLALYSFAKITEAVVNNEYILKADIVVSDWLWVVRNEFLDNLLTLFTHFADAKIIGFLFLNVVVFLFIKKRNGDIYFSFVVLGGAYLLREMFKWLIERPRPLYGIVESSGFSYPSGHSIGIIVFFLLLLYFFDGSFRLKYQRNLFRLFSIVAIFAVGFSRIYLHVHWFTDVLGGYSLGIFWFTLILLSYKAIRDWK